MNTSSNQRNPKWEYSRLDRVILHLRCLWRDHKLAWHLAGVWREVSLQ